jgi:hypothetical protein
MFRTLIIFCLSISFACAETRAWRSQDGTRTFRGDFVSREGDQVTIRREDGKEYTFALSKLHEDDVKWLDKTHPIPGSKLEYTPDGTEVFDNLKFGDNKETVLLKLRHSEIVEGGVADVHLARTGLNGIFRLKHPLGGLKGTLFFDWTKADLLRELSIHSEALEETDYDTKLSDAWKEMADLLTTLYGRPLQAAAYPASKELEDGGFLASHLWRLPAGGSVLLGTGREGNGYLVIARFTRTNQMPVRTP